MTENNDKTNEWDYQVGGLKMKWVKDRSKLWIAAMILSLVPFAIGVLFNAFILLIINDSGWWYYPISIPYANFRDYFGGELIRDLYLLVYGPNYGIVLVFISLIPYTVIFTIYKRRYLK